MRRELTLPYEATKEVIELALHGFGRQTAVFEQPGIKPIPAGTISRCS